MKTKVFLLGFFVLFYWGNHLMAEEPKLQKTEKTEKSAEDQKPADARNKAPQASPTSALPLISTSTSTVTNTTYTTTQPFGSSTVTTPSAKDPPKAEGPHSVTVPIVVDPMMPTQPTVNQP